MLAYILSAVPWTHFSIVGGLRILFNYMFSKFTPLLILLATASAACAYPKFSDIKAPPAVEEPVVGKVNPEKVVEI